METVVMRTPPGHSHATTLILVCVGLVVLIFVVYQSTSYIHWVGSKDLETTFRILDADSDEPVKGARISVLENGGFCAESQKAP
jgi:hypothetical protein